MTAPNPNDHAVLVGISRYPRVSDLCAPARDAIAIESWLANPAGGGLAKANIDRVKAKNKPASAEPGYRTVKEAFEAIIKKAETTPPYRGAFFGRRLYIYMSGHGFSTGLLAASLYTANALDAKGDNCPALGWFDNFVLSQLFEEYVLWLDFCRSVPRKFTPPLLPTPKMPEPITMPKNFVSFACPVSLRTVEGAMSDGLCHGAFTWTLLEGLKGAARTKAGIVTSDSLYKYLKNAMKDNIPSNQRGLPIVAKAPDFLYRDPEIVFGPVPGTAGVPAAPPPMNTYRVTLKFPTSAVGRKARLWSGSPPTASAFTAKKSVAQNLLSGLYAVDVPSAKIRHEFEVTGSGPVTVDVTRVGSSVRKAKRGETFSLNVSPGSDTTEIVMLDEDFNLYRSGKGNTFSLRKVPFGLYKIQAKVGALLNERIVVLDRDYASVPDLTAPEVPSAASLEGTSFADESHVSAIANVGPSVTPDITNGEGAQIFVVSRTWSQADNTPDATPWAGIQLLDMEGRVIADLSKHGTRISGGDPLARCLVDVSPGAYLLRQRMPGGHTLEQSLIASAGWRLEAHILRSAGSRGPGRPGADPTGLSGARSVSLLMGRLGQRRDAAVDRRLESARVALADQRSIVGKGSNWTLFSGRLPNPMAGLLQAHLLLVTIGKSGKQSARETSALDAMVVQLRQMVGNSDPDVEAISFRCSQSLRSTAGLQTPPMFARSWTLATEASVDEPEMVPRPLAERVAVPFELPPYFAWWSDRASARSFRGRVRSWSKAMARQEEMARGDFARPGLRYLVSQEEEFGGGLVHRMAPMGMRAAGRGGGATEAAPLPSGPSREAKMLAAQMNIPSSLLSDLWSS